MNTLKTLNIKEVSKMQGINILWSVREVRNNVLSDFEKVFSGFEKLSTCTAIEEQIIMTMNGKYNQIQHKQIAEILIYKR